MGASGLGSLLVKEGFLTEQDRQTITKTCGQGSWAFAKSIIAMGLLDEDELAAFFAERTRYQIAPKDFLKNLDQDAIQSLDRRLVSKLEMIPLRRESGKITVGVVDPLDRATLKQLEFFTGLEVNPVVVPLSQLYEGLHKIDPEFRMQSTALTHFLQNHAQSAWIRQKMDSDQGQTGSFPPSRGIVAQTDEELFEEVTEIEDEPIEMEELPSDDDSTEFDSIDNEASIGSKDGDLDEIDPFGGATTSEGGTEDNPPDKHEVSSDLLASFDEKAERSEEEDDGLSSSLLDRLHEDDEETPERTKAIPITTDDAAFSRLQSPRQRLDEALLAAENESPRERVKEQAPPSEDEAFTDLNDKEEFSDFAFDDGVREDDEPISTESEPELDLKDKDYEMPELSTFGFEETKPRGVSKAAQKPSPADEDPEFSIEDSPLTDDILDSLGDQDEPSLDMSALQREKDPIDGRLLADLAADDTELPLSLIEEPTLALHDDEFSPPVESARQEASFRNDEEETSINLRPTTKIDDDDDIPLHKGSSKASSSSHGTNDSGLNPTSALNEIMLKLSLSFDGHSARTILEEHLPEIGRAGCFINVNDRRQILWEGGRLIDGELGPAALNPMTSGLELNKWKTFELDSRESWTGAKIKVRIYKCGNWLWAHSLNESIDSEIFRETVESLIDQAQEKLGAG